MLEITGSVRVKIMSRIEIVNNYHAPKKQIPTGVVSTPAFNGNNIKSAEKIAADAYTGIDKNLGILGKAYKYLNKNDGEVQTQLMNALFTATLAPAFIAFNPLSKEEKKTKEYTALRQPISAAVALGVTMPITMAFNNLIENIGSKGAIDVIDLRMSPNDKFLGRIYKRAERRGKLESLKKEAYGENYTGSFTKEDYISKTKENAKKLYTRLICEKPSELKKDTKLPNEVRNLDKYIKENNIYEVDFKKFMQDNYKTKFFSEAEGGGLKEAAFEKQLKEIKAIDFMRKIGMVDNKLSEEELRAFISGKRGVNLENTLKNNGFSKEKAKNITEEITKLNARQIQYNVSGSIINEESLTLKQMLQTLKIEDKFKDDIQNKKLVNVLEDFAKSHLKGLDAISGKTNKDFAGNIMWNKLAKSSSHFGTVKKYYGIVVALVTLPFACGILNWSYPRIVESLFPELAKAKAQKGGSK